MPHALGQCTRAMCQITPPAGLDPGYFVSQVTVKGPCKEQGQRQMPNRRGRDGADMGLASVSKQASVSVRKHKTVQPQKTVFCDLKMFPVTIWRIRWGWGGPLCLYENISLTHKTMQTYC